MIFLLLSMIILLPGFFLVLDFFNTSLLLSTKISQYQSLLSFKLLWHGISTIMTRNILGKLSKYVNEVISTTNQSQAIIKLVDYL